MAFSLGTLTAYVEQNRLPLLAKAVASPKTVQNMSIQTGCKGDTAINRIASDAGLQYGKGCTFTASGDTTLTQRIIGAKHVFSHESLCVTDLESYWTRTLMTAGAIAGAQNMPIEESYISTKIESIGVALENAIWQNAGSATQFTGLIATIGTNGTTGVIDGNTSNTATFTTANALASVDELYTNAPSALLDKNDFQLFMGYDWYRIYTQALRTANLYSFAPTGSMEGDFFHPATNMKIVPVAGLTGQSKMFAGLKSNFIYGVDLESDTETFELYFDPSTRNYKFVWEANIGAQVAFIDQVVEYHLGA
jgi:hypothetical protein